MGAWSRGSSGSRRLAHVPRPAALDLHRRGPDPHPRDRGSGSPGRVRRDRAPRPPGLAARARPGRGAAGGTDRTGLRRGGRHRPPGRSRLRPHDGRPRHGGPRPGAAARDGARARACAGPGALHGGADGRRHPVRGRGCAAARGVLRPVSPAAGRGGPHAGADLRFHGVARPADRARPARGGLGDTAGAGPLASVGQRAEPRAAAGLQRVRGRVPRRAPGAGHVEGVRPERGARHAPGGAEPRAVPGDDGRARDEHAGPRHHGRGHRPRRGRRPRLGSASRPIGRHVPRDAAGHPHAGHRGVSPAAGPPRAPSPGHAGPLRGPRRAGSPVDQGDGPRRVRRRHRRPVWPRPSLSRM